ncbi:mechanosensitive ion channel family protein [Azospirillum sp. YIM B02556]|uniref:Mechanosensitive ion channel family protein n=1 Tax=Azospirillum endophyticum TaxID=2800326 RepID=A0ABS1F7R6_9PROT|nr:mechanosensitive ion channel family protein [Azospirillum endophyticum]MBK1839461.1 mechanosensitive ion channel family protein [Azospirillum endophyticum]
MNDPNLSELLADPIVQTGSLALIGALVTRVALRHHPTHRLVGQILFFAALTILLLYHGIVPYEAGPSEPFVLQRILIGFAKVVWWTNAAWALVGFARVFLIFERQPREGRLIQDLVVGMIYVGTVLSVIANVFSIPVGTLIATSGVFAIILGLAMQSTLSDVFSGIALNIGRPYAIGDWIVLNDGTEGRVVETNWRATYLLNGTNDLVVLPNSDLAKARLTNLSSPDRNHGGTLTVRLQLTTGPAAICEVMRAVLLSCNAILSLPEPSVRIIAMDAHAIEVKLSFWVAELSAMTAARNEIFDLIYRHTKAAGLRLAQPAGLPGADGVPAAAAAPLHRPTSLRLLDALPLFASLMEDEKTALAETMTRRTYRKDEVVIREGDVAESLMIVRSGVLAAVRHEPRREIELTRLAPGDCFGEGGVLMGAGEPGTIRALTFVVVYEIAKTSLAPLLRDRPGMVEELGATLARHAATGQHRFQPADQPGGNGSVATMMVARIRQLFQMPH